MYSLILQDFKLNDFDVLSVFPYGSRVYGTYNDKSDYDYIVVMKNGTVDRDSLESSNHKLNVTIYSWDSFQEKINLHKISALECFWAPNHLILKNIPNYDFKLDKKILRESISEKVSQSWVKAKKKFEVVQDRDVYIAKKSLFHSLRIIDLGIQMASNKGQIKDFSSSNYLWEEIYTNPADTWQPYKDQYQEFFNNQMTEFRKLAPK